MERGYGTIAFEWWGSPHRLYMAASAADGAQFDIRGNGVEIYEDTSGSWLKQYSHRITFPGHNLLDKPPPQYVALDILSSDGQSLDTVRGGYDAVRCACSVPVGFSDNPLSEAPGQPEE